MQESFEDRQTSTADALAELINEVERNEARKKEQAAKGLDALTYFVLCMLTEDGVTKPEETSRKVGGAFGRVPKLADKRNGAAGSLEEGNLCYHARRRRYRKGNRDSRGPLQLVAEKFPVMSWRSKEEFKERVRHWADKLDVNTRGIYLRPMNCKWASCSTSGNLNFNLELLAIERELGDYVIVHELLHFSVPNHGKLWKMRMRAHLGDYERLAERLPQIKRRRR